MPKASINLVVLNGEKYILHCLESVLAQNIDFNQVELHILDNGSTDSTVSAIENFKLKIENLGFSSFSFIKSPRNLGMWGGQEELLKKSETEYVVFLSVDVILDREFISRAIAAMEIDPDIGALQAKIYQYTPGQALTRATIDTCGFQIYRSRRIGNIGHGETERGQYNEPSEIFGVEGAVPVFRRQALESIRVFGEVADHDLFWYGEDLDVAWRLRLAGWQQRYNPTIIAWHDRGTTKGHTHGSWLRYINRVNIRQQIPIRKRRLEWRNARLTRIKNDHAINVLRDLPYILWREIEILGYTILFEPGVLRELPHFFRLIPRMFKKRKVIFSQSKMSPSGIHEFFV